MYVLCLAREANDLLRVLLVVHRMASRGGAQRANGSRDKICHFKLVLLGKSVSAESCNGSMVHRNSEKIFIFSCVMLVFCTTQESQVWANLV